MYCSCLSPNSFKYNLARECGIAQMKVKEEKFTTVPTSVAVFPPLSQQKENQLPNFTQCPIFYRPNTPITVHPNALFLFLACKYRPEYRVVCPIYLMPWLKGPTTFKVERNALLCFSPSSLQTLAGSDKLQTEELLPVCFQTMVILNLDRGDRK